MQKFSSVQLTTGASMTFQLQSNVVQVSDIKSKWSFTQRFHSAITVLSTFIHSWHLFIVHSPSLMRSGAFEADAPAHKSRSMPALLSITTSVSASLATRTTSRLQPLNSDEASTQSCDVAPRFSALLTVLRQASSALVSWLYIYVADAMPSSFQCRWLLFLSSLLSDFCVLPTSFYTNAVSFRHRLNFAFGRLVSVLVLMFVVSPVHAIQSLSAYASCLSSFFWHLYPQQKHF